MFLFVVMIKPKCAHTECMMFLPEEILTNLFYQLNQCRGTNEFGHFNLATAEI